jgi:hypothetical protein
MVRGGAMNNYGLWAFADRATDESSSVERIKSNELVQKLKPQLEDYEYKIIVLAMVRLIYLAWAKSEKINVEPVPPTKGNIV